MGSLIDKGKVVDKIQDLFLDKYEAKANSDLMEFFKEVLKILVNDKCQPWVSVKDRLPDADGEYLVYVYHIVMMGGISKKYTHRFVAHFDTKYKEWRIMNEVCLSVTHWMPLPQKPESEE